jgi:hypothetical protein
MNLKRYPSMYLYSRIYYFSSLFFGQAGVKESHNASRNSGNPGAEALELHLVKFPDRMRKHNEKDCIGATVDNMVDNGRNVVLFAILPVGPGIPGGAHAFRCSEGGKITAG